MKYPFCTEHQKPATILIVEDDVDSREILTIAFESTGHRVLSVGDGNEAIGLLESGRAPDLLILDMKLPGLDGLAICKWARERFSSAQLPILVTTAVNETQKKLEALEAGADDYLTKPLEPLEIVARARIQLSLRTHLARSEWRRRSLEVLFEGIPIGVVRVGGQEERPLLNLIAREILALRNMEVDQELVEQRLGFSPSSRCCGDQEPISEDRTYGGVQYRVDCRCITSDGLHLGSLVVLRDISRETELDQLKTEFAQVVSHELRTPLTATKNAVDLLCESTSLSADARAKMTDIAKRNVERMNTMVRDLLDLSRLEAGRTELTMIEGDVRRIIHNVVSSLQPLAENREVEIEVNVNNDLAPLFIDITAIERVVTNLLSNAIKYTLKGTPVTLSAEMEQQFPQRETGPRGRLLQAFARGCLCITVTDHGVGVPIADQSRIFDKFVCLNRQAHSGLTGTGLGLSIADKLVKAHGGHMWVESQPGRGATFGVRLPIFDRFGALAISLADKVHQAKQDRRSLGFVVLRLAGTEFPGEPPSVENQQSDLATIARQALYRAGDVALHFPHLHEIVLLLEGCQPELLPRVGARVARDVRRHLAKYDDEAMIAISCGHSFSAHDGSFSDAVRRLGEARKDAMRCHKQARRILLVDDDPLFLKAFSRLIRRMGYDTTTCTDGENALRILQQQHIDMVILDIFMPEYDGYRICLEIRNNHLLRDLPVFFISGMDRGDPRVQAFSVGGNEFLKKPLDEERLHKLLQLYLG